MTIGRGIAEGRPRGRCAELESALLNHLPAVSRFGIPAGRRIRGRRQTSPLTPPRRGEGNVGPRPTAGPTPPCRPAVSSPPRAGEGQGERLVPAPLPSRPPPLQNPAAPAAVPG